MTMGVRARDLSDDDLRRELAHLKEKAGDIAADGTSDQQANHRTRTEELEAEFLRRFLPESEQSGEHSGDQSGPPDSTGGAAAAGSTDVSPAGPDAGPLPDQPETDDVPAGAATAASPSDAPTDDPDRPANPA